MMFKTHLVFAFFLSIIAIKIFKINNQLLFTSIVLLASLVPDIDHPDSKFGKKIKLSLLFQHRGFFHSLFAVILFSIPLYFIGKIYFYAVLLGYLSHLLTDALTIQGIMFFHPFSKKALRGFIKTGSSVETIFFLTILFLVFYLLIQ